MQILRRTVIIMAVLMTVLGGAVSVAYAIDRVLSEVSWVERLDNREALAELTDLVERLETSDNHEELVDLGARVGVNAVVLDEVMQALTEVHNRAVEVERLVIAGSILEVRHHTDIVGGAAEAGQRSCLFGFFEGFTPDVETQWATPALLCDSPLEFFMGGTLDAKVFGPTPQRLRELFAELSAEELRYYGFFKPGGTEEQDDE